VRGRDGQLALIGAAELLRQPLDVAHVLQHAVDDDRQLLARLREPEQALAAALEELDAELVLQVLDVLADARLRGEQRGRHLGQVEVLLHRLPDDAELLEIHGRRTRGIARSAAR